MPDYVPGNGERVDAPNREPKGPNWLKRSIALGAAALTLGAAVFVGAKAFGGHESGPSNQGKGIETSAPATPGEIASATPSPQETHDPLSEMTSETFPFVGEDGKTYEGEAAFRRAIELPASDYDEQTVRTELLPDAITALNEWMASGATPESATAYANYTSPNGKKGLEGIAADFYDPAYRNSLTTNTTNTEDLTSMIETGHQNYMELYKTTKDDVTPYKGEYALVGGPSNMIVGNGVIAFDVHLTYKDNQSAAGAGENTLDRYIEFKAVPGEDGQLVWKIDRFAESALATN